MKNSEIATAIKQSFEEGYNSFATPCAAYNTVEEAWEESEAKQIHDCLIGEGD